MSSYRNYVPWKSNLPTSYKSSVGNSYSSRDDVNSNNNNNTDSKTGSTPRFGSLTSPAAYRPSYSGGTYRSVKREPATTSSTYISRYTTGKDEKEKPIESTRKVQSIQPKYVGSISNKENDHKISRYSTSTGNLSKYSRKSRDPSPTTERRPQLTITRVKSREPSPIRNNTLRSRSRDPSPGDASLKSRIASTPGYSPSYRLCPRASSSYVSRYGSNTSLPRSTLSSNVPALSYMSASDVRARSKSRTHDFSDRSTKQEAAEEVSSTTETSLSTTEVIKSGSSAAEINEPEVFTPVMVVNRGTSPTPPGSSSYVRARRTDLAKTIEKIIQKSSRKPECIDKEIQSDRLDDSTRYCRHNAAGRLSSIPYSGYMENKFGSGNSSRYSGSSESSNKTSRDPTSKSEHECNDKKKKDDGNLSNLKTLSARSSSKQERSKSSSEFKSSKSKQFSNKQKSSESLLSNNSTRSLPPAIPKADSPTKSVTSLSGNLNKWPNKDFRKSALNVGNCDRPRKSRTPSTGTDSEEKFEQSPKQHINMNIANPYGQRADRSSSVGSEVSSASTTTTASSSNAGSGSYDNNDKKKRCHQPKSKTTSSSSQNNNQGKNSKVIEKTGNYNKITGTNSNGNVYTDVCEDDDEYHTVGRDVDKQQQHHQMNFRQNSPQTNSLNDSSNVSKNAEAKSFLIRKLGSVSNFFATRTQDTSGETIYLDNSSSNSLSNELKQDVGTIGTVSPFNNLTAATTATNSNKSHNNNNSSNSKNNSANIINTRNSNSKSETDIEDSSWWLNTSQQIDTESALDIRDEMKYKLRHIDSGEIAWWNQHNDDQDDTIAEDLKILNQDEQNHSENTDRSFFKSPKRDNNSSGEKPWWTVSESEVISEKGSNNSTKFKIRPLDVKEPPPWWGNENSNNEINRNAGNQRQCWINENSNSEKADNGINQNFNNNNCNNKLRHGDSDETPWWLTNEHSNESPKQEVQITQNIRNQLKPRPLDPNERPPWSNDSSNSNSPKNASEKSQNNDESSGKVRQPPWWMMNNNSSKKLFNVRHVESGEKAWWLQDDPQENSPQKNIISRDKDNDSAASDEEDDDEEEVQHVIINNNYNTAKTYHGQRLPPLGDRASPEGVEDTKGRKSPYDNIPAFPEKAQKLFISRHRNIDDILGGSCRPITPLMDRFSDKNVFLEEITPAQVRIHDGTPKYLSADKNSFKQKPAKTFDRDSWDYSGSTRLELDDAALQVYKDGDYGAYLDLESSLAEQAEEIEGLNSSRKNSIVVRTQLSVRVHAIIEKLLSSEGSELRRALFSLKQIFQEDKDLVHGFVALGGLNCLVRVGNGADQNYQNYILRALGQVMLYVDGMNGVMKHGPTIQWLYSLIASKYRLVVKTALKLLLVFVEYVESNCYLLVNGIHAVDSAQGTLPWSNIMKLLKDYENADTELLIYATSLINKTLSGLSDQDSFYDESDFLEQQGMEGVVQRYMSRPGTDLDLLDQLQLYEAVLKFEDGETDGIRIPDNSVRKTLRYRSSTDSTERRKSRRHSTGTSPSIQQNISSPKRYSPSSNGILDEDSSSSNNSNEFSGGVFRDCKGQREGAGVTPGLRRRRERAERQKTFMREQQEAAANGIRSPFDKKDELNGLESENEDKKLLLQLKRDHTVKDLTQKLSNLPTSPQEEKSQSRIGDMTGLISKAKEGLAKSKSKGEISRSPSVDQEIKTKSEPKKSENELHWEELVKNMGRPLRLCDLDFTDLNLDDEKDVLASRGLGGAIPPPPPIGIPPPISGMPSFGVIIPPPMNMPPPPTNLVPPPGYNFNNKKNGELSNSTIKKNKKTVKLFWKEVREDMIPPSIGKTIWDELPKSNVDTTKLEHLFESRAKDLMTKKQQELNKNKEIIVLDHKRSNAINIAMTKLPPPRAIKAAILKMDATVVTREGIDKLLNMLPTDEERGKIQEAQMSNPELPLGSAEQFLLTLSSISELAARLKLWAFKLDFENSEKEIAEPLMDLKQGLELLKSNKTFKCILSTLLSVGIFLNGAPVKGFQIEYLAKVPEVKDTVHKHSLLHHLCHMVMESSPDTTDLYSEIGPITRASKADFTELAHNVIQLETECKASWDRLKLIAKHDCPLQLKQKLVDFLADCAERIIILQIVHRRVINRYRKFLLWLGVPQHRVAESRPNEFCRIVSEFALEYRTTRERVQQQIEKKANHRERNKTRGKMIIDVGKFRTQEDRADAELKQLLGSPNPKVDNPDGTLTWRRRRAENLRSPIIKQNDESFTDGDDEILESLVKTATKAPGPRPTPRERKRTRHADRKSLKRSRTREGFTVERIAASPEH